MMDTRCGLRCAGCEYIKSCGCGGCIATNGQPFHGACPVALCCQSKGFTHCGECPQLPCKLLQDYSCDPEHGDTPQGARIEQCRRWAELTGLMRRFADSGWALIEGPAKAWLARTAEDEALVTVLRRAEIECGSCGCAFDPLYKRALELLG